MPTDEGTVSDDVANALLNYLWRGDAPAIMPATTHWGLSSTFPGTDGSGITEPTGDPGYALLAVNRDHTTFDAAATRAITTLVDLTFSAPDPSGAGYIGIGWIPVWDDALRTTFLGYWFVDFGPMDYGPGIAPQFPAGALVWNYDS